MDSAVEVFTTDNGGSTPENIAERALNKIVSVSESAPPAIRDQALAYRDDIRTVLLFYIKDAIRADRVTLAHKMCSAGLEMYVPILKD